MVLSQIREELGTARRPWLGRYGKPTPIRKSGAFVLAAATREADGSPCVVLVPAPGADPARAARALARIEGAHRAAHNAWIPRVSARGGFHGVPYLELECDAVMDGGELRQLLIDARQRLALGAADAFAAQLRRALGAAHEARDAATQRPVCFGRLSYANLLFAPSGCLYLVGFGHNFPVEQPGGRPHDGVTTFGAPELDLGAAPSPAGDHIALHLLLRSLLPLVDLGPALQRLLCREPGPGDAELLHCLRWPDQHLCAEPPATRRSLAEAEAVAERLRALCGIQSDPEGLAALVRQAIQGTRPPPAAAAGPRALVLGVETTWAAGSDGARNMLGQAHRRIVTALAELHRRSPGAVLTMQEILEAGWPGERPIPEAGANRVYVALAHLRRMGMRDFLERCDGGYRFAPEVQIHFSR